MKKRESSSSSVEDSPHASRPQVELIISNREPRTRSRYQVGYRPKHRGSPKEQYPRGGKVKDQTTIDNRYLVATKQETERAAIKHERDRPTTKMNEEESGLGRDPWAKKQYVAKTAKNDWEMGPENLNLLSEAEKASIELIAQMNNAYKEDIKAFLNDKLAYHKVKMLSTIARTLENVLTRRKFLEVGGMEEFYKWLLPIEDRKGRWVEPSLAVKMGVLRIVDELRLSKEEIKTYAINVHKIVFKNMNGSKIPELKQMCASLMKVWDYTIYKQTSSAGRRT